MRAWEGGGVEFGVLGRGITRWCGMALLDGSGDGVGGVRCNDQIFSSRANENEGSYTVCGNRKPARVKAFWTGLIWAQDAAVTMMDGLDFCG